MLRDIVILLLIVMLPTLSFAMNDTDGVIAKGLFPLEQGSKQLSFLSETIYIKAEKNKIKVRRTYKVKNVGKQGQFILGSIYCYNCTSKGSDGAMSAKVSGKAVRLDDANDFLSDRGTHVKVNKMTKKECSTALEYLDGNIACHAWGRLKANFKKAEVKEIDLQYSYTGPMDHVIGELYLYTEKFWKGEKIPEIKFTIDMGTFPVDFFVPDKTNSSTKFDYLIKNNRLNIIIENYKPAKRSYTYQTRLTNSFIYQQADAATSFSEEKKNTLLKIIKENSEDPASLAFSKKILGNLRDERIIPFLIKDLEAETNSPYESQQFLIKMGSASVDPLIKLLNNQSWKVRLNALTALSQIKDERSVEPIVKLLEDENESIRKQAITALGRLGERQATIPLIKLLYNENYKYKAVIIYALGGIKDKRAIAPLQRVLKINTTSDRAANAAINVLAYNIRDYHPATVKTILNLLKSDRSPSVKKEAVRALVNMTYPYSKKNNFGTDYYLWKAWLDKNLDSVLKKKVSNLR